MAIGIVTKILPGPGVMLKFKFDHRGEKFKGKDEVCRFHHASIVEALILILGLIFHIIIGCHFQI